MIDPGTMVINSFKLLKVKDGGNIIKVHINVDSVNAIYKRQKKATIEKLFHYLVDLTL